MIHTLVIDIGATAIKMAILDEQSQLLTHYLRELTPHPTSVNVITQLLFSMVRLLRHRFDRIAVGFPGVMRQGVIITAQNLDACWINLNLEHHLKRLFHRPTRVINDADLLGYGLIKGQDIELVITLGTGVGSALFCNGRLFPNLELNHHLFLNNLTYEQMLGKIAFQHNIASWRTNLQLAITQWATVFNYQTLYLCGGHVKFIELPLPNNVCIASNQVALSGGLKLWHNR